MQTGFIPNNTVFFTRQPEVSMPMSISDPAPEETTTPADIEYSMNAGHGNVPGILGIHLNPAAINGIDTVFTAAPTLWVGEELLSFLYFRLFRLGSGCRVAWQYTPESVVKEDYISVTATDTYVPVRLGDNVPGGWFGNGTVRMEAVYARTTSLPEPSPMWEKIEGE